jgi:hypothetical protein
MYLSLPILQPLSRDIKLKGEIVLAQRLHGRVKAPILTLDYKNCEGERVMELEENKIDSTPGNIKWSISDSREIRYSVCEDDNAC